MTNPIGFYLDTDILEYIYEHRVLNRVKSINHYIRNFTLGLSKEEVIRIQDSSKRDYFLNNIEDSVVYPRDDGGRLTGAAHSAMLEALHRYLKSKGQYNLEIILLLQHCIEWCVYLVTNSQEKYKSALGIINTAVEEMPQDEFNMLYYPSSDLQREWYKRIKDGLVEGIERLELIDPVKFEELIAKLVDYSTNPNASLATELQQKQPKRSTL